MRAREFCGAQLEWTGTTPSGPWVFEASVNYDRQQPSEATWLPFTLAITPSSPVGAAAGGALVDFTGVPYPYIRITWDRTAGGSGDKLNGWIDGKGK